MNSKWFYLCLLSFKIWKSIFWKHATGGVQPFITDKMVAKLPIPDMSITFQEEVDDLIQESARLREEAVNMVEQAKNF